MVVPADLTMFTPLKSALLTTLVIWSRRDLKSAFRAWRLVVSSEVSEAARTLAFIWAIDHTAPLSLAVLIFLPVEMMFCVLCSSDCVTERFCRAVSADALVLMLLRAIAHIPF